MHEKRFSGDIERLRSLERVERLEVPRVIELCLEGEKYNSILDVGTGSGLFAQWFADRGLWVAGIDVNFEMLLAARGYVPGGGFTQALGEALPFRRGAFDLIFYGLVVHEADDPVSLLQFAWHTCRKRVCIMEWPYRDQPFGPPVGDRVDPDKLLAWVKLAGFSSWECFHLANVDLYHLEV